MLWLWALASNAGANLLSVSPFFVACPCLGHDVLRRGGSGIGCQGLSAPGTDLEQTASGPMPELVSYAPVHLLYEQPDKSPTVGELVCRAGQISIRGVIMPCRRRHYEAASNHSPSPVSLPPSARSSWRSSLVSSPKHHCLPPTVSNVSPCPSSW